MKKSLLRFCSILLVCTILLSCITINTFAVEDEKSSQRETINYYGRTGDLGIGAEKADDVIVIDTLEDYYSVVSDKVVSQKDIAMTGVSLLPSAVDNSESEYFPAIGDQGGIGACVVFACVYYQFTYTMNKQRKVVTTPDNTFSVKWMYNLVNYGRDDGSTSYTIYKLLKQHGCPSAKSLPYDGKDYLSWSTDEKVWREAMRYRLKSSQEFKDVGVDDKQITSPDDEDLIVIKTALSNGDVLKFSSYIYSWEYDKVKENASVPESNKYAGEQFVRIVSGYEGGHGMAIVGYNDNLWCDINGNNKVDVGEMGAFKIANSWGVGFGNKGFMWIPYDTMNKISSVPGIDPQEVRVPAISEVNRIDVCDSVEGNDVYAKVTLNTADRSQFGVRFFGERNGTESSSYFLSGAGYSSSNNKYAFDGTNVACDATFVYPINDLFPDFDVSDFESYTLNVQVYDYSKDNVPVIIKRMSIVNEHTGKEYVADMKYPTAVDGDSVVVNLKDATRQNAVIYYIGYDEPDLYYKVGNSEFTRVKMLPNDERHGALYKYVIEDVTGNVSVYFGGADGQIDDNNGKCYSAQVGLNNYFTQGVCDELVINDFNLANGIPDTSKRCHFDVDAEGGYAPYKYSYVIEIPETGFYKEYGYDYNYDVSPFIFSEEGTYRITVNVMDYAKQTTTTTKEFEVVNHPFEITSVTMSMSPAIVSKEVSFTSVTSFEGIASWGGYSAKSRFVVTDKDGKVCADEVVKYSTYSTLIKTTSTIFNFIPAKSGEYTLTVSSTDCNKEYAEKTIRFMVSDMIVGDSDGNGAIDVMDATKIQMHLASLDTGKDIFFEMADSDISGDIGIIDATYIQMYVASLSDIAKVGTIIEYIPPVEPPTEEPTEKPTEKPTDPPVTKNTVTFTNSFNWGGTIYCYYWSDSNTQMTSWPGVAMANIGKNDFNETLYTLEVPSGVTHIIFSNGSTQTTDIDYSGGEVRYYPLSTTDSKGHNLVQTW